MIRRIGFVKNIEKEIIFLSHIDRSQFDNNRIYLQYLSQFEGIKTELSEISKYSEKIEKFKKENSKYYALNEKDIKDLISIFKAYKLKVYINNPINLENGKILGDKQDNFLIYDNSQFAILNKFPNNNINYIKSAIELDNKDLILNTKEYIYIYKYDNNNYNLFQIISDKDKYKPKYFQINFHYHYLEFDLLFIKKLSENRFMSVSSYGFEIYSKDENKGYSPILTYICDEVNQRKALLNVYAVNEKEFILINRRKYKAFIKEENFITYYDELVIEKLELKINDTDKNELNKNIVINEDIGIFSKIGMLVKEFFQPKNYEKKELINYINFDYFLSDFLILLNKYFCIMVDDNLLILNIENPEIKMKRYYIQSGNIVKWNSGNDNKFLLIDLGNVVLFELNEYNNNSNKICVDLKITGYINIPYLTKLKLIKINEKNRYYREINDYILLY